MKRVSTATKGKDDPNDPNIEDEEGTETDLVIESESRRKLEQKMSSKLQKAGLDTGGRVEWGAVAKKGSGDRV